MRKIQIQATRSVKIADLDPKWLKHPLVVAALGQKDAKGNSKPATEIMVGLPEGSEALIPQDIAEAVKVDGETDTYETYSKQKITQIQNAAILKYVNDVFLAVDKRKGGEVLRLELPPNDK